MFGITPRQMLHPIELFVIVDRYFPVAPIRRERPHRQVQYDKQQQQPRQPWRVCGVLSRGHGHAVIAFRQTRVSSCKANHSGEAR